MLPSSRNGFVCIRCSYRLRLRALQQKRLASSSTAGAKEVPIILDQDDGDNVPHERDDRPFARQSSAWRSGLVGEVPFRFRKHSAFDRRAPQARYDDGLVRRAFDGHQLGKWTMGRGGRKRGSDDDFPVALHDALRKAKEELKEAPVLEQVAKEKHEWDGASGRELGFNNLWNSFTRIVMRGGTTPPAPRLDLDRTDKAARAIYQDLADAHRVRGSEGLDDRIKYHFYGHVIGSRFTESDISNQKALADLRYPSEWYPATRAISRTIHLHVGPTNSGKTYQALQRLEQAESGAYGGPLRLLAHEVYSRLNAKGKKCALLTGEEKRIPPGMDPDDPKLFNIMACTVEMLPINRYMDVVVLDEIQMIGNSDRGWAWTQALLGVKAKEVHLCGEERAVSMIKELCASVGDELIVHHYKRLSPLVVAPQSLEGDLRKLRKGDCIVSFSIMGIHALRKQIELATNRKVAIVYGSLPPETRAQQARLFNEPDNDYDYLVASDAVGMGLNLAIKRIIFESSTKFNGLFRQTLDVADIKQIGGRAGRFRIAGQGAQGAASTEELAAARGESRVEDLGAADSTDSVEDFSSFKHNTPEPEHSENVGLVTTLERFDYPIVRAAMESEPEPITTAGLYPPGAIVERFAGYFPPGTPFSYILTRLHELSQVHTRFHLCGLKEQVYVADLVESVRGLTIANRHTIVACPASKRDHTLWKKLMPAFARCIAEQRGGHLADIKELPLELMESEIQKGREYLNNLEQLHKGIVTYLWLSYRFAGVFTTRALAFHAKKLLEEKIEKTLGQFNFTAAQRKKIAMKREKELLQNLLQGQEDVDDDDVAPTTGLAEEHASDREVAAEAAFENMENEHRGRSAEVSTGRRQTGTSESNDFDELGSELEGREPALGSTPAHLRKQAPESTDVGGSFSGEGDDQLEEPELLDAVPDTDTEAPHSAAEKAEGGNAANSSS